MKKMCFISILLFSIFFLTACGGRTGNAAEFLMEPSAEAWTKEVATACHLEDLGKPLGTVKEEFKNEEDIWEIRFSIDEEMTQDLIDGYAKTVWNASVEANNARPHSCNGYIYEHVKEACKLQEPLNYYIWYYFAEQKEFRVGIYPTMMEEREPGGLVLRIERWN